MRLLLCAVNCPKGDVAGNLARHHELVREGRDAGCDLVLLPEMSLTGYRAAAAIGLSHPAVTQLTAGTAEGPSVCFGLVEHGGPDEQPFITQVLAVGGEVVGVHRKLGLGEDEDADFQPGTPGEVVSVSGVTCSVAVCAEIGTEPPYRLESRLVLAPSAPGLYGARRVSDADWRRGFDWWRGSVLDDARRLLGDGRWLAVSTQAGATDDEDFPGWAALVGPGGDVLAELRDWHEATLVVDLPSAR